MTTKPKQGESGAKPSAHTPGPWSVEVQQEDMAYIVPACLPETFVAEVWSDDYEHSVPLTENNLADARLIASAPELLEALEAVDRLYSTPVPNPMWPEVSPYGLIPNSGEVGKMIGAVRDAIRKARG
ncbi:MAG TPA: hypothetical protein VN345_04375 [Blastocatellia bacterium]|jgi:hypothetical protein|nr:hypothetical protein [Blastocatellia bacterium]